ncbi:MAG: cell wall metabolism sensor histidine kinase WalK [Dehalococcoidia bacterium]|nr:cell wall metabolism sensor histidine kinase WalK [Dehalococcoidia bacterium]MDW8120485.1 ATP-binding protein [Chloroflexota bacterium]
MGLWVLVGAVLVALGGVGVLFYRLRGVQRAYAHLRAGVDALLRQIPPPPAGATEQTLEEVGRRWQTLLQERETLHSALTALQEGVLLLDGEDRLLLANPAAWTVLGAVAGERGQRPLPLLRDHQVRTVLERARATASPQRGEVDLLPQGKRLEVTAVPLEGGVVLMVMRDLTPFYRLQTTRREFVANVSHQLRTPLAAMRAAIETLEEGALEDPAAARSFLARLKGEVERMERLVRELLDLSRLESGQVALHLAPLPVEAVAQEVAERFAPLARQAGLTLTVEVAPHLPPVLADRDKLLQALSNLLDNALKFTPAGGKVWLRAHAQNGQVVFSVEDTGIGIAPEHLPHIFERFYKAHRTPDDAGAGLGLAIVKHIAQVHGGSVEVESQEGRGSRFTLRLPAARPG